MIVYIKSSIKNGTKIGYNFDVDVVEVSLLKTFFGFENDIIIFTYASPLNSSYTTSRNVNILEKIESNYTGVGNNLIIMGDLNGKTKQGEDFVRDESDKHSPINVPFYSRDSYLKRENMDDHPIDEQGKLILDICKSTGLRILNGRTPGDKQGKITRFSTKNVNEKPSVIDYALCSEGLRAEVHNFTVLPYTGHSDHCCISLKIKTNTVSRVLSPIKGRKEKSNVPEKIKYTFDKQKSHIYEHALRSDKDIGIIRSVVEKKNLSTYDLNEGVLLVNKILLKAAKKVNFVKRYKPNSKHSVNNAHSWFTKECKSRRTLMRFYGKNLSKSPFDKVVRKKLLEARTNYKKICRKSESISRKKLMNKLTTIGLNNPKAFWSIIKEMNNWGKKSVDPADKITCEDWEKHFKELLNDKNHNDKLTHSLNEINTFDPTLDGIITDKELREALTSIKIGKAVGPDEVLGEYLKVFGQLFEPIMLKLVRAIFSECSYPDCWTINFLKPIYKKGLEKDTNNFRGLAIGSVFGKLYSTILLNRLIKYISEKKLISPHQIGFMKNSGTSDHIFLLQTIIEKVVKNRKCKLFAAFIDFKKAYDTVSRDTLLERLKSLGINGFFLRNIASMYSKVEYKVKLSHGDTQNINSNLGLKQGCPLSPMLFNLYIDDINEIFDASCDAVAFQNDFLNHFLYADDLVLISQSNDGLQSCLDKVHEYATKKNLTINIAKSKCMVFNQTGKLEKHNFTINYELLENVNSFCYLGFDVKSSGTVKHAMSILNDKAKKALRPLMTAIAQFKIPVETSIRLFHTYISPILLYNVENWSTLTDKKILGFSNTSIYTDTSNSKIDLVHRRFLKYVLGVTKSCPNLSVYGETGETPISLKGYRLTLNFWYRVSNLPDSALVKKALLENINLRTNWIKTIEKLINHYNLADCIDNHNLFKRENRQRTYKAYNIFWENELRKPDIARLQFYKGVKTSLNFEEYLKLGNFKERQAIAKLRCSDHSLEIEKGRHRKIDRSERFCKQCNFQSIETEEHFLLECRKYDTLRQKYNITELTNVQQLMNDTPPEKIAQYLCEAFSFRDAS